MKAPFMPHASPQTLLEMNDRILSLAAQGLKVRDISSLLGVHPLIVLRVTRDMTVTETFQR